MLNLILKAQQEWAKLEKNLFKRAQRIFKMMNELKQQSQQVESLR